MNISVSYAGGLFDLIGSAVSTVTGNSSEEPKNKQPDLSGTRKTEVKDGWTIITYDDSTTVAGCENE
jgi:hypothetical protein